MMNIVPTASPDEKAPKKNRTGIGLFVILVLIGGAFVGLVTHQVSRRSRYDSEGRARANLAVLRSALSIYAKDNNGKYPQDLKALAANREYLNEIPILWRGLNSFSQVDVPHEPSSEFAYYPTRALKDSGKWAFVNNENDKDYGTVYIDCTHTARTDSKGSQWAAY